MKLEGRVFLRFDGTAWTDLATLSNLGSTLAGQSAEALGAQTRANLRQIAETNAVASARVLELGGRIQQLADMNEPALVLSVPVVDNGTVIGAVVGLVSLRRIVARVTQQA